MIPISYFFKFYSRQEKVSCPHLFRAGQELLVNPDRDLVAVYTGYFNEDQSELSALPRLRQVLNGVFEEINPAD